MRAPLPGYPHYEITDDGEVYRIGSAAPLRAAEAKRGGYLQVSLWEGGKGKTRFVHQLVALAFHGPRPSPRHHAGHRDGNKLNNAPTNVQWITKEENEADKLAHGTSNRGERSGTAKLTAAQVAVIRSIASALPRSAGGCRIKKGALAPIAQQYGVTQSCLRQILSGQRWQP